MASVKNIVFVVIFVLQLTSIQCSATKPKIIIIGAGAAGIAAGTKLMQNGFQDVTILEAENRIGGRIFSSEIDGVVYELGADTLLVNEGSVFDVVKSTGMLTEVTTNMTLSEFYDITGSLMTDDIHTKMETIYNGILNDLDGMANYNKSVEEFVNERLKTNTEYQAIDSILGKKYYRWHEKYAFIFIQQQFLEIDAKTFAAIWQNLPKKILQVFKRPGFRVVLDALMNKYPDITQTIPLEEKIIMKKEVTNIDWTKRADNKVMVTCKDGTHFVADHVIVTVPLGVLKERITTMFTPKIPSSLKTVIDSMGFVTVNHIYMKFSEKWWPEDFNGFSFLWSEDPTVELKTASKEKYLTSNWITRLTGVYPIKENILSGYISGEETKYFETLTDTEVKDTMWDVLKMFLGKKYNVTEPVTVVRSKWYSNLHFRGTDSCVPKSKTARKKADTKLAWKNLYYEIDHPLVLFAGEATSTKKRNSVDGAIKTGWKAANTIVEMYE